jgi:hypothetical protein
MTQKRALEKYMFAEHDNRSKMEEFAFLIFFWHKVFVIWTLLSIDLKKPEFSGKGEERYGKVENFFINTLLPCFVKNVPKKCEFVIRECVHMHNRPNVEHLDPLLNHLLMICKLNLRFLISFKVWRRIKWWFRGWPIICILAFRPLEYRELCF